MDPNLLTTTQAVDPIFKFIFGVSLVMLVGITGTMIGFVIRFTITHRRIWARIAPRPDGGTTVALASVGHRDVALATEHAAVVEDIRRASRPQED